MTISLEGKKVLVTGGCRGIGAAITLAMARAGADVIACYRSGGDHVDALATRLDETPGKYHLTRADVTSSADIAALVQECRDRLGSLDVLVNNAGVISHIPFAELKLEEWQRVVDTNLTSVFAMVQAALPLLSGNSSVISIGSGSAFVGLALRAHYTATKAGLVGLSRSMSRELGPRGIRVNVISPGVIQTEKELSDEIVAKYTAMTSAGRLGRPDEIANVAVFLASDLSSYISGADIDANGGI
ncbi:SDR family oxidoreductase [Amycolatopsis balhimycina DSM 5908]|uniref:SDR family oxidoreductase n=1 Tax=Amycolatopsis balhimycina DSM 5908 TaxID=1081091 RepID=A0A428WP83_AMYBA|nr:SDR family oxidoreductase [Amycolatopsis balhimycina]RSM44882.1 SDR family oxidoreductase [Amycolatopsis balhimycina DSM 5908]